ncbi:MAG: hypothetical protein WCZ65_00095 [Lysobacteraceae bacterium]
MILRPAIAHQPDSVELRLADPLAARALLLRHRPDVIQFLAERRQTLLDAFGPDLRQTLLRADAALMLSLARMGCRHGSWGDDFHHYHNENHSLEILDGRIGRLMQGIGLDALSGEEWVALQLFATCHDLRQREQVDFERAVGNNEDASIDETVRILDLCGFCLREHRGLYLALELMIAGSTFDARPAAALARTSYNSAEVAATGGALAPRLGDHLDRVAPDWRADPQVARAVHLALIASDLDTANVAEAFPWLAESASRLCQEREMRSGRRLESAESAQPCVSFLSDGQERYFFELHRFCSAEGEATFAATKADNAPRVRAIAQAMRERFAAGATPASGLEVVREFSRLTLAA